MHAATPHFSGDESALQASFRWTRALRTGLYVTWIIARKEVRDALRNRWFILYAIALAALSLGLSSIALAGTGRFGVAGFGRTAASLINLVLLIVPLMSLTLGAATISGERERGSLEAILAQPIGRTEVLLGKFLGLAAALLAALAAGYGTTGAVLALKGNASDASQFFAIFGLSVLLAWAMLAFGIAISSFARRTTAALGLAIFAWLGFVCLGDLGLMGGALTFKLTTSELLAASLANPLTVFKLAAVGQIQHSLDVLGPAGLYATQTYGRALPVILVGILLGWTIVPLLVGLLAFSLRGVK